MNAKKILWKKIIRFIAEYGSALIIGYILYKLCRTYAVAFRGNEMYGGECAMLGMPFWWGGIKCVIADLRISKRATKEKTV